MLKKSFIVCVLALLFVFFSSKDLHAQATSQSNEVVTRVGSPPTTIGSPGGFVYYCQGNTQWANNCALGNSGCVPTSLAMVMSTLGVIMNPAQVDEVFRNNGWRTCGGASNIFSAFNSKWFADLGFEVGPNIVSGGKLDLAQAKNFLEQKYLIVGSSKVFPCANCKSAKTVDHIFVVDGIEPSQGKASIRDANNCSYADGNDENQANILKDVSFAWYYAYPVRRVK